ncbi:hypothetical protein Tsubulata_003660 [Turnera subulata]|uniref:Uncharacterized protein n=1 Tax=Turnera subulata TaxID=218843 RepID=A0A9Q0FYL2_9ROSI|nr:hypothetical protein Tsubulata_003660 [Turnera subulata]
MMNNKLTKPYSWLVISLVLCMIPLLLVSADQHCTCDSTEKPKNYNNGETKALTKYKLVAISSILAACVVGLSIPIFGKRIPFLRPENNIFFLIKGFAAGVILASGFVHILPNAFDNLTSPCLELGGGRGRPWGKFPLTGFVAMLSAIITMMIDAFANSYYKRLHLNKALPLNEEDIGHEELQGSVQQHQDLHAHHSHASSFSDTPSDILRHRIISQVLELGIVVHSVIIGIALGASKSTRTIKPLVAALTFHQLFEGMGLGGCIAQAKFKSRAVAVMFLFFCLTTPIGISIGIGISKIYNENSPTALIVGGVLDSASAGILIYMALVDILAADFMNPKMNGNLRLQLGANLCLLMGTGCMSLLAKWA